MDTNSNNKDKSNSYERPLNHSSDIPKFIGIELPDSGEDDFINESKAIVKSNSFINTLQMQILTMFSITKIKTNKDLPYIEIHKSVY
jgi:hypothetical protein